MLIPLNGSTDLSFEIDQADAELVSAHKWYINTAGYVSTVKHRKGTVKGDKGRSQNLSLHRLLMGSPPADGLIVDHKDTNKLNNKRSNLRWVTKQQNAHNSNPVTGYKGVRLDEGRYTATLRGLHLGSFATDVEAAQAYDKAARHFYKEFAFLNFPEVHYQGQVRYVDFIPDTKKPKSAYTGVSYFGHGGKRVKRWRATYRHKTLGYYTTEQEAADAYIGAKSAYNESQ